MNERQAFFETLEELMQKDEKVILLYADVGFSYLEDLEKKFPNQFVNTGVIEQTMMGMAAGLASIGWKPYVYSMIPFVTMRCYEQLRNDVCYHKLDVKIIGVRGSVHYKFLGFSHNIEGDEDKIILEHLPEMRVHIPENPDAVRRTVKAMYEIPRPCYIRI